MDVHENQFSYFNTFNDLVYFKSSFNFDKDYIEVVNFFTTQKSKVLVSLMLVFAYFFSALSISEVFEDYIQDEKIKNAANKALNIFAIIMPLITIIIIFNLN